MRTAVIVDVVRTASGRGKSGGALANSHPVELLATVLRELVTRNDLDAALVDDVIVGCVSQVGEQSLNIGRQAVLAAGWPDSVPSTSIDRQCGSSQQAAHFAAQGVMCGAYDIAIAAGVESMSRVLMGSTSVGQDPMGPSVRARYPDGLINQGVAAEHIARRWGFSRDDLDMFSQRSHRLAAETTAAGGFDGHIVPVTVTDSDGRTWQHLVDETIRPSTSAEGLSALSPAFGTEDMTERFPEIEWKITPGNSSPLTDGASGALIMAEEVAVALGLVPRARFHSFAVVGDDPFLMLTAPIPATRKVLERARLTIEDIDVYEVNEAFAPVPLAWAHDLHADPDKLNPHGGAIALGHALGASGTRLLSTMLQHLETTGGRYGLQTMCEAGGMANAMIIERL